MTIPLFKARAKKRKEKPLQNLAVCKDSFKKIMLMILTIVIKVINSGSQVYYFLSNCFHLFELKFTKEKRIKILRLPKRKRYGTKENFEYSTKKCTRRTDANKYTIKVKNNEIGKQLKGKQDSLTQSVTMSGVRELTTEATLPYHHPVHPPPPI